MITVRTFLAVSAAQNLEVYQMDVHDAFLHGDICDLQLVSLFTSLTWYVV